MYFSCMLPRMVKEGEYRRKDADYWRSVHDTATKRLAELRAERDALDAQVEDISREILRFEQVVAGLYPITSDGAVMVNVGISIEGLTEMGLADACREILKNNDQFRTARGIRDSLAASGYDLNQHSNPLASIHGVLKRMAQSGEVEELENEGKTRYRWRGREALSFKARFLKGDERRAAMENIKKD